MSGKYNHWFLIKIFFFKKKKDFFPLEIKNLNWHVLEMETKILEWREIVTELQNKKGQHPFTYRHRKVKPTKQPVVDCEALQVIPS